LAPMQRDENILYVVWCSRYIIHNLCVS